MLQYLGASCCVSNNPNLFLMVILCLLNLSSGENLNKRTVRIVTSANILTLNIFILNGHELEFIIY